MWSLIPIAILIVGIIGTGYNLLDSFDRIDRYWSFFYLPFLLAGIVYVFVAVKISTYRMGWIILQEDDSCGAFKASKKSAQTFKGRYLQVFLFLFSFLGWYFLVEVVDWLGRFILAYLNNDFKGLVFGLLILIITWLITTVFSYILGAYADISFIGWYEHLSGPSVFLLGENNDASFDGEKDNGQSYIEDNVQTSEMKDFSTDENK